MALAEDLSGSFAWIVDRFFGKVKDESPLISPCGQDGIAVRPSASCPMTLPYLGIGGGFYSLWLIKQYVPSGLGIEFWLGKFYTQDRQYQMAERALIVAATLSSSSLSSPYCACVNLKSCCSFTNDGLPEFPISVFGFQFVDVGITFYLVRF
ncbi:hypothetical protein SK128_027227 [Halocaridina rubra]|uniref:Uncharacterized protein n=1 Tax=Halocaridina rubra TaxID=373956 RepID=A0AAN8ZW98_HALRR